MKFTKDAEQLDWAGIAATRLNAEMVRAALGWKGVFSDPHEAAENFPHVVCSGWKPGRTTDYCSALLASLVDAVVVNMTDVDHVYDKNPREHSDAKPIEKMDWERMTGLCGRKHKPGINTPFDPEACRLAAEKKLKVVVLNGRELKNLAACLEGKRFAGTTIQ